MYMGAYVALEILMKQLPDIINISFLTLNYKVNAYNWRPVLKQIQRCCRQAPVIYLSGHMSFLLLTLKLVESAAFVHSHYKIHVPVKCLKSL